MFGIGRKESSSRGNDTRPVRYVKIDEGIWQIVYADE